MPVHVVHAMTKEKHISYIVYRFYSQGSNRRMCDCKFGLVLMSVAALQPFSYLLFQSASCGGIHRRSFCSFLELLSSLRYHSLEGGMVRFLL